MQTGILRARQRGTLKFARVESFLGLIAIRLPDLDAVAGPARTQINTARARPKRSGRVRHHSENPAGLFSRSGAAATAICAICKRHADRETAEFQYFHAAGPQPVPSVQSANC